MTETVPFDPAAARLDQDTENELYALYRAFFAYAEDNRVWNLWDSIPWASIAGIEPSQPLADAVLRCYENELFLPDYMALLLKHLRSSRARTWFTARWAYEEGKHLLALGEWLTKRGLFTDTDLSEHGEDLLAANRWAPPSIEATALFADALLFESQELARYRELRALAEAENDAALLALTGFVIRDEETHRDFFAQSLNIIGRRYPEKVASAIETVAATQPDVAAARGLLTALVG